MIGVDFIEIKKNIKYLKLPKKRFELRGQIDERSLYDDYAHHPNEIKETIKLGRLLIQQKNNNKFLTNKKKFLYNHKAKKYSLFYKNSQRNKMFSLFQGNTEDKLKALKIAEELADKSTLSILRKGLRDMSPKVVEISAFLIRKFK